MVKDPKNWITKHQNNEQSSWEAGEQQESRQGRPKVKESKKRKPRFTMNLNDEELALIIEAAEQSGQSQASFSRSSAIKAAKEILAP